MSVPEVVISVSKQPGTVHVDNKLEPGDAIFVWELKTGSVLASYKPCSSETGCLGFLGENFIVAPQDVGVIHFWNWDKSQPTLRSTAPEKLSSIVGTKDGKFCIGGGYSGKIYVWECSTGSLIATLEAHYKKVNNLTLNDDDSMVVACSDDAGISVWLLSEICDISKPPFSKNSVRPFKTFNDHVLAVTQVLVGAGGVSSRLFSVSMDRSCRIWDLASKNSIMSMTFPSGLLCCATDNSERRLFVGGVDGKIYPVELFSAANLSERSAAQLYDQSTQKTFEGHKQAVVSLAVSLDSNLLVSASIDCSCRVWDLNSRQVLKVFTQHRGPVTSLFVRLQHSELLSFSGVSGTGFGGGAVRNSNEHQNMQLQSFKKHFSQRDTAYLASVETSIDQKSTRASNFSYDDLENEKGEKEEDEFGGNTILLNTLESLTKTGHKLNNVIDDNDKTTLISRLQKENSELKAENERWKKASNQLFQMQVQSTLNSNQK